VKLRIARWLFRLAPTQTRHRYRGDFGMLIDDLADARELRWGQCVNIAATGLRLRLRGLGRRRGAALIGALALVTLVLSLGAWLPPGNPAQPTRKISVPSASTTTVLVIRRTPTTAGCPPSPVSPSGARLQVLPEPKGITTFRSTVTVVYTDGTCEYTAKWNLSHAGLLPNGR
jgi:hypothetical protein